MLAASTTGGASRRLAQLPITAAASVAPAPPSANVTAAAADLSADLLLAALAQVKLWAAFCVPTSGTLPAVLQGLQDHLQHGCQDLFLQA